MSSSATVSQTRTAIAGVNGTLLQIVAVVTNAGTLPDNGFFLYQIGANADPTTDTFTRVATLSDYGAITSGGYGLSRWNAIAAGQTYYRTPQMTITFNDVNTATAGQTSLNNNIDALVNAYEAFSTSFQTLTPSTVYYPTSDPSILSGLITTWQTAQNSVVTAQTSATTAAATLAQSQSNLTNAQNLLSVVTNINTNVVAPLSAAATALLDNQEELETQITAALADLGTPPAGFPVTVSTRVGTDLFSQLATFMYSVIQDLPNFPTSPAQTDLSNALQIFQPAGGSTTIVNLYKVLDAAFPATPFIPATTAVTTAIQAAQSAVQSTTNSFNSAAANAAITAQNLIAAQNMANSALAAVVAVCPDFDPGNPAASLS
jgi:hypothetical protein